MSGFRELWGASSPEPVGEESYRRLARIVAVVSPILALTNVLSVLVGRLDPTLNEAAGWRYLELNLPGHVAAVGLALWVLRRAPTRQAMRVGTAATVIAVGWQIVTSMWVTGSVTSWNYLWMPIFVMAYRIAYDVRMGRFVLFSMLGYFWALVGLEAARVVTPHPLTPARDLVEYSDAAHQITASVWISLIVLVAYVAANYVANRIRAQEQALRELNETLEERVKEQTTRLERASRLRRYLAPQLVERLMTSDAQLASIRERRPITVMFADLRGFTPMVESLPPEVLADLLNHYFDEVADIAFRHGGTIDKFIGDAVMVFFGAPEAATVELQAQRCVRMALEIQRRIGELAEEFVRRGAGQPLAVRIGVASGVATVGEFGARHRTDFTVVGAPVNRAARLEPLAPPGGVLIDSETRALLGDSVQVTSKGTVTLKGFTQPIEAFLVDDLTSAEPAADAKRIDSQRFWR